MFYPDMEDRRMRKFIWAIVLFAINAYAADQAEIWMQEGLKILKEKPEAVVQAAGFFAKAADAYEAKGDEGKAAEANSCLYWTRKKFTIRDLNIVTQGNPAVVKRMDKIITEKPKTEDVKGLLDKVDEFAKTSKDSLLVAIRYFEIADRFPTSDEGRKAMDASLKAMAKINLKEEVPAKNAVKNPDFSNFDGKWLIKYRNGASRHYTIKGGDVFFKDENVSGKIEERNKDIVIVFENDQLEIIKLTGEKLIVDHYNPVATYPGRPKTGGIGAKEKGARE